MIKYLAYFLIIIGWSFHTNRVEAVRTTLHVGSFGGGVEIKGYCVFQLIVMSFYFKINK
ncbi:MAG: hypothetical protein K2X02_09735 [Alphaproteobacteria bacterium]|nr:hypothetical protein [Alphaproteobacteria bacterium]